MAYFPFFIDIKGKRCVIVGGGSVAKRKVEKLLPFGADIIVVAPWICDGLASAEGIEIRGRGFLDSDIDGAFMVIAATDDGSLNEHIYELCSERNVLVNTVDDLKRCGFIFPALVNIPNAAIGISTSGKSPLFAAFLRERIEEAVKQSETVGDTLIRARERAKKEILLESGRRQALRRILEICTQANAPLSDEQISDVISEYRQ